MKSFGISLSYKMDSEPPKPGSAFLETEADLDLFLDKIKTEYKDGWTEENWEEVFKYLLKFY
jgi:hypothetical protein